MTRLIRVELAKVVRRRRTYVGYAGVLLLLTPFLIGLHYGRPEHFVHAQVGNDFEVVGSFFNALFLAYLVMKFVMVVFMPFFGSTVAGDMVAGEAGDGTLRTLLVRPVDRTAVALAKFGVAALHAVCITFFLLGACLLLGGICFGFGDLFLFDAGLYVVPMGEGLLRLAGAHAAAALAVLSVASVAFLISVLVDSPLYAVGGAMAVFIAAGILTVIPYFEPVRPYLFVTHMDLWQKLFLAPVPWGEVGRSAAWLAAHIGVCVLAAVLLFRRKDILS